MNLDMPSAPLGAVPVGITAAWDAKPYTTAPTNGSFEILQILLMKLGTSAGKLCKCQKEDK
jgi:hypothetical protein